MRNAFADLITEIASQRKDICLLSGDIGNRMFDRYKAAAPDRFFNCGIAEANMMSMAAGLGLCGMRPFVYTITPFITTRCLEQIKIGVGYHESPVTVVGTGSGLSYAELGATHHSLDDIAAIRTIPGIDIYVPCDREEVEAAMLEIVESDRPAYLRLGKKGEPTLSGYPIVEGSGDSKLARELSYGDDLVLIGAGPIIENGLRASEILVEMGISCRVISINQVRPAPEYLFSRLAQQHKRWVTLEEHQIHGGLGSEVLEWLNTNHKKEIDLLRLGTPARFIHLLGDQISCRESVGLNSESIAKKIYDWIGMP